METVREAFHQGTTIPFKRLYEGKLSRKIYEHYPITVKDDKVYTPIDSDVILYYIPEWTFEEDLDAELDIPDSMLLPLKERAIASLAQRLGITTGE